MCFYYECILIWTRFEWNFSYRNKHELHAYIVFIIIIVFLAGQESIAWILYIFHSSVSFLSVLSLCLLFKVFPGLNWGFCAKVCVYMHGCVSEHLCSKNIIASCYTACSFSSHTVQRILLTHTHISCSKISLLDIAVPLKYTDRKLQV